MSRKTICVIGFEEAEMLKRNEEPYCPDHHHVSRLEANQMTGRGDFKPYFIPIAEWVGPKHIRMLYLHGLRGASCKFDEYVLLAVKRKEQWALVMRQAVKRRPDETLNSL